MADYVSIAQQALAARAAQEETSAGPSQQQELDPAEESWTEVMSNARTLLAREGVLFLGLQGDAAIGIWSDRDGPEIREALRVLGKGSQPIRYLDGDNVPVSYKLREVEGEPVPMTVLRAMEAEPKAPWEVRDRMLTEIGWRPEGMTWDEWRTTTPVTSERDASPNTQGRARTPEEKV